MYAFEFLQDEKNQGLSELLSQTKEFLGKSLNEMKQKITDNVFSDIENWIDERSENVYERIFDKITKYILNGETYRLSGTFAKFIKGIGFDADRFRKLMYDKYKAEIIESIENQYNYETLKRMFISYFDSWEFKDINTPHPQTEIVEKFLNYLMKKESFNKYLSGKVDKEIEDKKRYLEKLNNRIIKAKTILGEEDYD